MDIAIGMAGLFGLAIGIGIGTMIGSRFSNDQQKTRDLEKHLHDKQDEIKNYQQEVRQHFSETAGLLRGLAENYRDVHNHLAQGAEQLCSDDYKGPIIKKLPEVEAIEVQETPDNVSAPLDYAPKSTPYDKSVLTEDYDLEKIKLNETLSPEETAEIIAQVTAKAP